jgi:hippurate hydrolase
MGARVEIMYKYGYPPTVNHEAGAKIAAEIASSVFGPESVELAPVPSMGAEDFSYMLEARPGAYIWIGNGSDAGNRQLHNGVYDFNDEALPLGATYWSKLVETVLPR